jgi:hypothetical protein
MIRSFVKLAAVAVALAAMAPPGALALSAPQAAAGTPSIPANVDGLLRDMASYLGSASALTFHADVTFDHVLPSGQKVQFSAAEDVALQRPGKLYVEWVSDLGNRQFWYDGAAVTLYDPSQAFYASAGAPPTLEAMLDGVEAQTGFAPPLADFLYSDPYGALRGKTIYGFDLGPANVDGRTCRSLAFVDPEVDWQIWIQEGPQPVPCKLVITYKAKPSQPQFSATFTDWDFTPRFAAPMFTASPPAGTRKVPFGSVTSAQ